MAARPFILAGLLVILAFLFSFIGISASDFFCPNLSTIATYLGLSESTAGVTFLAFGNGSPDVFSTFAALKNDTFGLAIGELIGAATFSEFTLGDGHANSQSFPSLSAPLHSFAHSTFLDTPLSGMSPSSPSP